jgi:hypothetical protein
MKLKFNLPEIEKSSVELKELYLSPVVEIFEVKVEKGFAASRKRWGPEMYSQSLG